MKRSTPVLAVSLLLATVALTGCGSSGNGKPKAKASVSPVTVLKRCLRAQGYTVEPESPEDVHTAPRRFAFVSVWNLVQPANFTLALTISKSTHGAAEAVVWTRAENAKIGKGVVRAPVVQFGKIDLLWTAVPNARDVREVDGCVRPGARALDQ